MTRGLAYHVDFKLTGHRAGFDTMLDKKVVFSSRTNFSGNALISNGTIAVLSNGFWRLFCSNRTVEFRRVHVGHTISFLDISNHALTTRTLVTTIPSSRTSVQGVPKTRLNLPSLLGTGLAVADLWSSELEGRHSADVTRRAACDTR